MISSGFGVNCTHQYELKCELLYLSCLQRKSTRDIRIASKGIYAFSNFIFLFLILYFNNWKCVLHQLIPFLLWILRLLLYRVVSPAVWQKYVTDISDNLDTYMFFSTTAILSIRSMSFKNVLPSLFQKDKANVYNHLIWTYLIRIAHVQ